MLEIFKLNHSLDFPSLEFALEEPNGLLAFGGDLSPKRLKMAYKNGIFPWYSEQEPILWWSPEPRAIFYADEISANKTLRKNIKKFGYYASLNKDFNAVIDNCANVPRVNSSTEISAEVSNDSSSSTWINVDMMNAYTHLHELGYAHSVEVYNSEDKLVGGLYGVVVSGVFCGESMFHLSNDASKTALLALAQHMLNHGMNIIDCQLVNPHLLSLGCKTVSRKQFLHLLENNKHMVDCWGTKDLIISL
ncbi:leucyl/phenylalanyl-tRNA--protein transferase [Glaciecola petra]|uniref:Leucyl/phenylalanyl-tRNA--protein transferase n=1 Tax=Glaciecola petra TaxID=3075602 RepID=A0ABU2ZN09_9ALTE|nr:leucyl/phenylalanyl-tRNA--protein transferase [Aestuariibacter sp. P117]MDT0594018.1 leucyl/phenylalanyl-tRNA--protein transferase [Aestuariibacter sp. P117]